MFVCSFLNTVINAKVFYIPYASCWNYYCKLCRNTCSRNLFLCVLHDPTWINVLRCFESYVMRVNDKKSWRTSSFTVEIKKSFPIRVKKSNFIEDTPWLSAKVCCWIFMLWGLFSFLVTRWDGMITKFQVHTHVNCFITIKVSVVVWIRRQRATTEVKLFPQIILSEQNSFRSIQLWFGRVR